MSNETLTELWQHLEASVRGYLYRRLSGDSATVDDLTQETFMRIRRSINDLRDVTRLLPWTMRITHHVFIDYLRRAHPSTEPLDELTLATDIVAEPSQLAQYVALLTKQLTPIERDVIRLVDEEGLTGPAAAQHLGISLSALKARLFRARQRLRTAVDDCCHIILDGRGTPHACEPKGRASCATC